MNLVFLEEAEQGRIDGMVADAEQIIENRINHLPAVAVRRPAVMELVKMMYYHPDEVVLTDEIKEMIDDMAETTSSDLGVVAADSTTVFY